MAHRAQAVAAAWQGSLKGHGGLCQDSGSNSSSSSSISSRSTTTTTIAKMALEERIVEASTTTQMAVIAGTTSRLPTGQLPAMGPLRGIAYGALPCTSQACGKTGWVSEDMMQEAYAKQWGDDGRDDLGTMAGLGANAVRLYHSLGLDVPHDHGGFLDRAQAISLNVMPGYHTELVHTGCPKFDCFKAWKQATLQGFRFGFKRDDQWHPAISALILLNEPDFFGSDPMCKPTGAWCRVKALLSALDGMLAAEREAGVKAGRVKLTVTWSFGVMPSIDGKESGPGLFGFQDTVAGIADPAIAHYTPRSSQAELEHAFKTRWVHGVNTQAPWSFVKDVIAKKYTFSPIRWFIGEYGANGQPAATIQSDLEDMQRTAEEEGSDFLGAAFFQFQTAHFKGGAELNFGMFRLGSEKLWDIHPPCYDEPVHRCPTAWPVYCLSTDLDWLPNTLGHRAQAVADAWKGSLPHGVGICKGHRRLSGASPSNSTRLACWIHSSPASIVLDVESRLKDDAFSMNLTRSTRAVLGNSSDAILGELALDRTSMFVSSESSEDGSATKSPVAKSWMGGWLPHILVAVFLMAACGLACCGFLANKNKKARQFESDDTSTGSV